MERIEDLKMKDRIYGCLVGGAVGDALGYPVEFSSYVEIRSRFGENGIRRYVLDRNGVAEISDDTQMTLFTAGACLLGMTRGYCRGIMGSLYSYCRFTYLNWLFTQTHSFEDFSKETRIDTWLMRVPELYSRRAPGNTCISALESMNNNQVPRNNSCGCGGVMRIAPLPLVSIRHNYAEQNELVIAKECAEAARFTHQHPLGFMPAAVLSLILTRILKGNVNNQQELIEACDYAAHTFGSIPSATRTHRDYTYFDNWPEECRKLESLITSACQLAVSKEQDIDCIRRLGEGWTGHEALAIAVFCAIRHFDNFEKAIVSAVNHDGDSDSTGSICGQIMGAIHGMSAIPDYFTDNLELKDVIEEMADDLYSGCIISEYCEYDSPEKVRWLWVYAEMDYWEPKKKMIERLRDGSLVRERGLKTEYFSFLKKSNN